MSDNALDNPTLRAIREMKEHQEATEACRNRRRQYESTLDSMHRGANNLLLGLKLTEALRNEVAETLVAMCVTHLHEGGYLTIPEDIEW